jgi:hypothetical protein
LVAGRCAEMDAARAIFLSTCAAVVTVETLQRAALMSRQSHSNHGDVLVRKLAITLSASALLFGLAAASANAQTQTGASQLRALIQNATPVEKIAKCPNGRYWICKGEPGHQQCGWKCY